MVSKSQVFLLSQKKSGAVSNIVRIEMIFLLIYMGYFCFTFSLNAQEKSVEETNIIREGPPPLKNPQYLDLGTFVVNMPGDKYFLKSSIQLAFENSAAKEWLIVRLPIAKDLVITHLNSITVEQFDEPKNRAVIKNDIQVRLNSLFPNKAIWNDNEPIKRIYFLEFYRQ